MARPRRGRGLPAAARGRGRGCRRRPRGRERPDEADRLRGGARAAAGTRRGAAGVRALPARALQGAARGDPRRGPPTHPPRQGGPRPAAARRVTPSIGDAWIVAAARTPFTRATKGALASVRPDGLLAELFRTLMARVPAEAADRLDEVIVGCAYPESEQGRNVARAVTLAAG